MTNSAAVCVKDHRGYGDPVHDVTWEVSQGSLAAIIGPNGGQPTLKS